MVSLVHVASDALAVANPWWADSGARPELPPDLPGGLSIEVQAPRIELVYSAPRAGATTLLLRTVAQALDAGKTATFVPAAASAAWGTPAMVEGALRGSRAPDVIAIDRPAGDDWAQHLKVSVDGGLAQTTIVIALPGLDRESNAASVLAGRQGAGQRRLLLPRRLVDWVAHLNKPAHQRLQSAAEETQGDLQSFARRAQLETTVLTQAWDAYVSRGSLPRAFALDTEFDAEASWAASGMIWARRSRN